MIRRIVSVMPLALTLSVMTLPAQQQTAAVHITAQDLLDGLKNPSRWLTFSGDYTRQRHSPVKQSLLRAFGGRSNSCLFPPNFVVSVARKLARASRAF
jgi:hypothetical protein